MRDMNQNRNVMRAKTRFGFTMVVSAVLMSLPVMAADGPPDLTKGETTGVDRAGTYNLGATGLRGWMGWGCMNTSGRCRNVFLTPKG